MTLPLLYFVHGWSYDASFWHPLCAALPEELSCSFYEAGYFGRTPLLIPPSSPYLAIGHSAGVMTILHQDDPLCLGLIAFNGFACFAQSPSFPQGIPPRILQRMITKMKQTPDATLTQFRKLCGEDHPSLPPLYDKERLGVGLEFLMMEDTRPLLARWNKLLISITGTGDPLFPAQAGLIRPESPALWESQCWEGGHLLPVTHKPQAIRLIRDMTQKAKISGL